jgi:hypothetical protein
MNVAHVNHDLVIGQDVELYMTISIDGDVIIDRKGDSLTGGFLALLYPMFSNEGLSVEHSRPASQVNFIYDMDKLGTGGRVRIWWNASSSQDLTSSGSSQTPIRLMQIEGVPELVGSHIYTNGSGHLGNNNYRMEIVGTEGVDISGWVPDTGFVIPRKISTVTRRDSWNNVFRLPQIQLGTGDAPVKITDRHLTNMVGSGTRKNALQHGATTVSLPAIITGPPDQSEITFTKDFTNNGPEAVHIKEAGLFTDGDLATTGYRTLIARDLINFTIPVGSTVTVNYRIRTNCTVNGGIMIQFNEILTRRFRNESREAKDVLNENRSPASTNYDFLTVAAGGTSIPFGFSISNGIRSNLIGPVVGRGQDNVSHTNFALADRIGHGQLGINNQSSPDLLVYHGAYTQDYFEDESLNRNWFKCYRVFENRSGAPITVYETGLYSGVGHTSSSDYLTHAHMLARHKLATPITIPDGGFLKLTYTIAVQV